MNAPIEGIFVTVSVLLLTGMVTCRPRRRFCENFPFAPRCLGVAAKRDVSHSYNTDSDLVNAYKKLETLLEKFDKDTSEFYDDGSQEERAQEGINKQTKNYPDPYQAIKELLRPRRNPSVDNEILDSDFWKDYE